MGALFSWMPGRGRKLEVAGSPRGSPSETAGTRNPMEHITLLLDQFGYPFLFAVGFLEFVGAPVVSVPVLVVAGAAAASGTLSLPGLVVAAALGGLVADLVWYGMARWRGRSLVDTACGLSSNPMACILKVEARVRSVGPIFLVPAKFLPGSGNLVAAASGFAGTGLGVFATLDALGLLIWGGVYGGAGWLFRERVEQVVDLASGATVWIVVGGVILVGLAGAWRIAKIAIHGERHRSME